MKKLSLILVTALTACLLSACQNAAGISQETQAMAVIGNETIEGRETEPAEVITEMAGSEEQFTEPVSTETVESDIAETEPTVSINNCINLFVSTRGFNESGMAAVQAGGSGQGKYGFIDSVNWNPRNGKNQYRIEPQFFDAYNFSEGLAAVNVKGLWGFINTEGTMVIDPQYVEVGQRFNNISTRGFVDGYALVKKKDTPNQDWLLIDKDNNIIETISRYSGNYIRKLGYITNFSVGGIYDTMYQKYNNEQFGGIYDDYGVYSENYLVTYSKENGYFIIDGEGNIILEINKLPEIAGISNISVGCSDKYVFVKAKINSYISTYLYDTSGNFLGEFEYTDMQPLGGTDYLSAVPLGQDKVRHVINKEGDIIFKARNNDLFGSLSYEKVGFSPLEPADYVFGTYDLETGEIQPLPKDASPYMAREYVFRENYIIKANYGPGYYGGDNTITVYDKTGHYINKNGTIPECDLFGLQYGVIPVENSDKTVSFYKVVEEQENGGMQ